MNPIETKLNLHDIANKVYEIRHDSVKQDNPNDDIRWFKDPQNRIDIKTWMFKNDHDIHKFEITYFYNMYRSLSWDTSIEKGSKLRSLSGYGDDMLIGKHWHPQTNISLVEIDFFISYFEKLSHSEYSILSQIQKIFKSFEHKM